MNDKKLNFTYLLGAGASAESVPVVKDFPGKLHTFCEKIDEIKLKYSYPEAEELRQLLEEVKETIKNSASFDTYAKTLYLSGNLERYHSYKRAIASYLIYNSQMEIPDKRYDLFFAALLEKDDNNCIIIPDNVNIISWNYDRLVEMSLSHMTSWDSLDLEQHINLYSNYTSPQNDYKSKKLNLIKLNGTAGKKFYYGEVQNKQAATKNFRNDELEQLKNVVVNYEHLKNDSQHTSEIQFSWEKNNKLINDARVRSKEILTETDHLIVIGYSFPTFNRQIDFDLLKSLNRHAVIHLQTKEKSLKSMKQRLCALTNRPDDDYLIKEYTEVDEFFIPYEFNHTYKH